MTDANKSLTKVSFPTRIYNWYAGGTYDQLLVKCAITIQLILLSLSLVHQTTAVAQVTGMSWWLAFMQAVVQDFGLFVAELILIRFLQTGRPIKWAMIFVIFAALASGSANVYDFTHKLEAYTVNWWLSALYGGSVPVQVLLLGKLVAQLTTDIKSSFGSEPEKKRAEQSDTHRNRKR